MGEIIARHGFDMVEIPHPAQAGPTQDPTDGRRRRFGYRRLFILLRQDGERSAINRIYRLYREEGLTVRKRRARRLPNAVTPEISSNVKL